MGAAAELETTSLVILSRSSYLHHVDRYFVMSCQLVINSNKEIRDILSNANIFI